MTTGASGGPLPGGWRFEHLTGDAESLHLAESPECRTVRWCEVDSPALVLGSGQDVDVIDRGAARRAGVSVVRRRSGGGAVLLRPGEHLWFDVFVPADDPLHDDDVERASWWVGEWWAAAVAATLPGSRPQVHRGPLSDRAAGTVACFASVGPGEVVLHPGGRAGDPTVPDQQRTGAAVKVVGISQRRTRSVVRFQTVAFRQWDPDALLGLLVPRAAEVVERALVDRVAPVPASPDGAEGLRSRLLTGLPT